MSVIPITRTQLPGPNALTGVGAVAGTAAMPVTSGTDSYTIPSSNTEILIIVNTTAGAQTFPITGVTDPHGRIGNFSMSVPGSAALATVSVAVTPRLSSTLWASAGLVTIPATCPAGLAILALTGT
jgi:hypothetical protein